MSADAAPVELAGNFLEWQLIEDEKAKLAERSKDLFKAMKEKGFNTRAARVVFREKRVELSASVEDAAKAEQAEAEVDLYRSVLDRGLASRVGAGRARAMGGDAPAKLVETVVQGVQTDIGRKALVAALDVMIDAETGEIRDAEEHHPPSVHSPDANAEQADVDRSAERASSAVEIGAPVSPQWGPASEPVAQVRDEVVTLPLAGTAAGPVSEPAERSSDESSCINHQSTGVLPAGGSSPSASEIDEIAESAQPSHEPVTAGEGAPPPASSPAINSAMQAKTKADVIRLLRPFCKNADDLTKCGGQGSKHCVTCEAIKQSAKVEA